MSPSIGHKTLVIGLGNEYRGDDAIGLLVVQKLQMHNPDLAEYLLEQNDLTRILDRWKERHVIIIDAVFSEAPSAGKVHQMYSLNDLSFINRKQYSSHGLGLSDIYNLGHAVDMLPQSVHVIGIEGVNWQIGSRMSQEVEAAIPGVIQMVLQELNNDLSP